jgi:uncharacterized protein (DUF2141 family)
MLPVAANAEPPLTTTLTVHIEGMRSKKGIVRACLTRDEKSFPHCDKDPAAYKVNIPAPEGGTLHFTDVTAGHYAITVLHDENGNAKVDTMLGIPREGVGFSRNPRLIAGPPSFAATRFAIGDAAAETTIKLKYFL